jgi:regulator of RNase E activity RraA
VKASEVPVALSAAPIESNTLDRLSRVSTATLTSQLLKRGFRRMFLAGLRGTSRKRLLGRAFTLRYAPSREDVGFHVDYDNESDLQRIAVETTPAGAVLVIDARGELSAASFGHIIATRMAARGVAGLVTDGCLRDSMQFSTVDMPVYFRAPHATTSSVAHWAVDLQVPIGCAGVLVKPGDVMVGDEEGVVVVPAALVDEIARDAARQEEVEEFALERIRAKEPLRDLYPLKPSRQSDYEAWRVRRSGKAEAGRT